MFVLKKIPDPNNEYDQHTITFEFTAVSIEEMLEAFQDFLAGCGFSQYKLTAQSAQELYEEDAREAALRAIELKDEE